MFIKIRQQSVEASDCFEAGSGDRFYIITTIVIDIDPPIVGFSDCWCRRSRRSQFLHHYNYRYRYRSVNTRLKRVSVSPTRAAPFHYTNTQAQDVSLILFARRAPSAPFLFRVHFGKAL